MRRQHFFLFLLLLPFYAVSQVAEQNENPDNDCQDKFYIKTYGINDRQVYNFDFAVLPDNSTISCGYVPNFGANDLSDAFLIKTKADGTKLWEKIFGATGEQTVQKITSLADGNLIMAGSDKRGQELSFFLSKIDPDGNILWKKNFRFSESANLTLTDIKEDSNGDVYILAYYLDGNLSIKDALLFMRFNATGTLQFCRKYVPPSSSFQVLFGHNFIIHEGYSYITGHYHHDGIYKGLLLKINNTSATHQWTKVYDFNGKDAVFHQILLYGNQGLCLVGTDNRNQTDTSIIVVSDFSGNVNSSKYFQQAGPRNAGRAVIDSDNEITLLNYYYRQGNADFTNLNIARLHPLSGIKWSRNYNELHKSPMPVQLRYSSDSSLFFSGNHAGNNGKMQFYLGKASKDGDLGCAPEIVDAKFGDARSVVTEVNFSLYDVPLIPMERDWQVFPNKFDKEEYLCNLVNLCTSLKLSGNTKICNAADTIRLTTLKDLSCFSLPVYSFDKEQFRLVEQTANLAKFIALKDGSSTITARINNGCSPIEDNIVIDVKLSPGGIDLGKDTSICKNNMVRLSASKGFVSYLWQDGSTDSVYLATAAGNYSVESRNACGESFNDEIEISVAPPVPFDLGIDLTKCNNDTLTITAPGGFINYNWTPKTEIKQDKEQTAKLFPHQTVQYKVVAEKTPGCFAEDSILVKVNRSPEIHLGKDTSLCQGDSIKLDAGDGFARYIWNIGKSTQEITVAATGKYSIKAIDDNGCSSVDTLAILNVHNNPLVKLDKNAVLCQGQTKTLNAGSNYKNYLWSTGSGLQTITINQPGTYKVKVEDKNGCVGIDSTSILTIQPTPANFLPKDTSLCTYSKITLKADKTYSTYLWSTTSKANNILIDRAGFYWLEVSDEYGCTGTDSIIIKPEQCMEGFYIPTAFTPNTDGKNDTYRPLIFGKISYYRFAVYNRWGEKLFSSMEPDKGWDGKVVAAKDKTSVFIWTCEYQLENREKRFEKGTVTLIR